MSALSVNNMNYRLASQALGNSGYKADHVHCEDMALHAIYQQLFQQGPGEVTLPDVRWGRESFYVQARLSQTPSYLSRRIERIAITYTPDQIAVGSHRFRLSREMKQNLAGLRGDDHRIDLGLLSRCLQRRRKHIRNWQRNANHSIEAYYFKSAGSILTLLVGCEPEAKIPLVVTTGYYPTRSYLKEELGFSDTRLDAWIQSIPDVI